jgi:hypothetical protein
VVCAPADEFPAKAQEIAFNDIRTALVCSIRQRRRSR